ncbi:ribosome biogenesis GTPase YlqF [Cylindrospermopsis raciborskii S07]|jgi:ribosome biogenesis GTPase A|uniref:Ribosome biogenesis GTPase A n=4 Tax=Cylindrospermopsis TaxID=77021 RepID=A0A7H0F4F8_9CYAN|nr:MULTISPECIES: ribosome biogenesis GTPase YlqF [Cylindrospermopsis]MBU6346659.1 ribosome biogenesis GTPase YlqF [Cyanobacteria bacterium REEB494]EFA68342.1 GTP-binding protein [Cylindrospermopsis raciborskii CS-505]KRH95860.1 ribosome biogenesis GTPase YlqF [Cylindrospermopsis sp. CR12]MBA4444633.1 ribosome biogenesis GTPase YlqF [Cylindrospermopsis raciborskii CS-506_C]MBA4448853.1 ribosome biogenesis GTPase YlqF [Cylindrospermopsis raciborskii CS-506_D]
MSITQNYKLNIIQWYPGHIAKAEKNLKEQLKRVDVILEVRDARIPLSTHHPQVKEWIGNKSRVLVINRLDMILPQVKSIWSEWLKKQGEVPYFANAQQGQGITAIAKAAQIAGTELNERRKQRGMLPRPVRAVVIGFPNVGKSALINRLLGKRVVESAARPGVTRQLRWVKISEHLELLDAPGIIPSRLEDQQAAVKLAICDDIGEASYDNQLIAAAFVDMVNQFQETSPHLLPPHPLLSRYGVDSIIHTGEAYLEVLAASRYQGDVERTARTIISDFRKGLLGAIVLEVPKINNS